MFIPVEPAYLLALQHDAALFQECFDKRIMPVGPSTLLATLRTVAHIWRNEQQNQNALAIAAEGGRLYDKFTGFVQTLETVGKNIDQAQSRFNKPTNSSRKDAATSSAAPRTACAGRQNHQTPATRFDRNRPRIPPCRIRVCRKGKKIDGLSRRRISRRRIKDKRAHDASFYSGLTLNQDKATKPQTGTDSTEPIHLVLAP